jgi:hypothetical protein
MARHLAPQPGDSSFAFSERGYRMSQYELHLPPRPADDVLRERLAAAVEELNASTDARERVQLHAEVTRLRRLLRQDGGR